MKLPPVSGQKVIKILSMKGFYVVRQKGSHVQMKNVRGVLATVPVHGNKPVSTGIILKILRDAEISREEFMELEKKA